MRNLRTQLFFSHLLLATLMLAVMILGLASIIHLGRSIDRILKDNYKSVVAAQNMKEALERMDSSATFTLAGQTVRAARQYEVYRPQFERAYQVEAHNITEVGEQELSDYIGQRSALYCGKLERLIFANLPMAESAARDYYFQVLEPAFTELKQKAQQVLELNQVAILRADEKAKREARSAFITGLAATTGAFLLAVLFAHRAIRLAMSPLLSLARQAEEIGEGRLNQRIELRREDEIGTLANSFNEMAENLREARREEAERLRRAERMSDAAIDSLYDPVIVTDASGCVVHLNRAAEGLFGSVSDATGQPISRVALDNRITKAVEHAIQQERTSAAEDETGLIPWQVNDSSRTYRLRTTPMHDDDEGLLGAVAVLEDVTHLRELDRLKTEFIGVASHELKTPVTSLLLSVQLLEDGVVGPLSEGQREVVAAQKDDLQRLERMMRDLLELTKLETGVTPPRFEIAAPSELIKNAAEAVRTQAEAADIMLTVEASSNDPSVRCDPPQIVRVLLNLLNNSIRHTPSGGAIRIGATVENGNVVFSVGDTGSGIPPEYLPRVFERFVQVPGATRGGAGLGLSIAQSVVRAHGGDISVESTPGQGSTFRFNLPVATESRNDI